VLISLDLAFAAWLWTCLGMGRAICGATIDSHKKPFGNTSTRSNRRSPYAEWSEMLAIVSRSNVCSLLCKERPQSVAHCATIYAVGRLTFDMQKKDKYIFYKFTIVIITKKNNACTQKQIKTCALICVWFIK
jgi:hypothetical protein